LAVPSATGHNIGYKYTASYTESQETSEEESHWEQFDKNFGAYYTLSAEVGGSMLVADWSVKSELGVSGGVNQASGSSVVNTISRGLSGTYSEEVEIYAPDAVGTKDWVAFAWGVYRKATVGNGAELVSKTYQLQWGNCKTDYPNCEPGTCAKTEWEEEAQGYAIKACYTCTQKQHKITKSLLTPKHCFPECVDTYNARSDEYCDDWWYDNLSCRRCTGSALDACAWKCCEMCAITQDGQVDSRDEGTGDSFVVLPSTGGCPQGRELTEAQCEGLSNSGEFSSWETAGTYNLPETCGCFLDQNGKRYFNRMTGECNQPDSGEQMICKATATDSFVVLPSTGKCAQGRELTEAQCEGLSNSGAFEDFRGADTWNLPETCGCFIDENGGRYFNRLTGECNQPEAGEQMICKATATVASSAQENSVGRNVFAEFVDDVSIVNDKTLIMSLAFIGFFYTIFYAYRFLTKAAKYSEIASEQEV